MHFFRTAIVLPISALCFLPNPEFKPHVPCVLETRGSEIYIFTYNGLDEIASLTRKWLRLMKSFINRS